MSAVFAVVLCLSVSVTSRCSIETDGRIELVFGMGASIDLFYTIRVRAKMRLFPRNFVPNSGRRKFLRASRSRCQHNSSTVYDAYTTVDELRLFTTRRRPGGSARPTRSVLHKPLTPVLPFIVDLLYNLFLQLFSCWQDLDRHITSRGPSAVAELLVLYGRGQHNKLSSTFSTATVKRCKQNRVLGVIS